MNCKQLLLVFLFFLINVAIAAPKKKIITKCVVKKPSSSVTYPVNGNGTSTDSGNGAGAEKTKEYIKGANPYMPFWEHVPDGEPRVFEYEGKKRVFIYGSHDTAITEYCGTDQVVWSAPVEDLTDWTYHGVCYESTDGSLLYAPDVVQKGDTFYLYAAEQNGSAIYVATSKSPTGPFTDPVKTEIGFDPGVLVDDDGRVYVYWGFSKQYSA
jgi:hypothetical protein